MTAESDLPKKKTWSKPEIYLLDTNDVNGGTGTSLKEGIPIGSKTYIVNTPSGLFFGNGSKDFWDDFHS